MQILEWSSFSEFASAIEISTKHLNIKSIALFLVHKPLASSQGIKFISAPLFWTIFFQSRGISPTPRVKSLLKKQQMQQFHREWDTFSVKIFRGASQFQKVRFI